MSPLSRPSRSLRAAVGAVLLLAASLAALDGHAAPAALPAGDAGAALNPRDLGAALAQARTQSEAAEAALDAAKRIATPGHLLDPLPARLMAGLGELQAEYAEMERKAAGYRATLGDQHPTLKGADEVLAELREQILDEARRAGAAAQQDATRARAAVASLDRQARAAEATGSIAPPARSPGPAGLPAAEPHGVAAIAPVEPASGGTSRQVAPTPHAASVWSTGLALLRTIAGVFLPLAARHAWAAAAAGLLAVSMTLGLLVALFRPRARHRSGPAPIRIEPSAPVEPVLPPVRAAALQPPVSLPSRVPVLATLSVRADDDSATVHARLDRDADADLARGAAAVVATLATAARIDARNQISVVVTPAAGALDAQAAAAALALASAAAGAGRRVLLIDGHPEARLGRALAPRAAVIAVLDIGGRTRQVLRVDVAGRVLAVLAGDAEEPTTACSPVRLPNLDGFDAIFVAGQAGNADVVAATVALMVAPDGADAEDLAAAARIAAGETGRPCGVLLVEAVEDSIADLAEAPRPSEPAPSPRRAAPEAAAARQSRIALINQRNPALLSGQERRDGVDESTPSRLGLRRTLEPVRRRA